MKSTNKRYPKVSVKLVGQDGNAFAIMGRVTSALRAGSVSPADIKEFQTEAMSSDYAHLLRTCMNWVNVQ